jgi:hypothetical protein
MIEVILDIEKALKMDTLPPPNPRQEYQSSEIDRFFHLLNEYAKGKKRKLQLILRTRSKILILKYAILCFCVSRTLVFYGFHL